MIRPLNRAQITAMAPKASSEASPAQDDEAKQRLVQENTALTAEFARCKAALVASEDLAATLTLQLAEAKLQQQGKEAKATELAQKVAELEGRTTPASAAPTVITVVDVNEDKKGADGSLSAKVKLDDAEAEVFLVVSLDVARKLIRKVKEA